MPRFVSVPAGDVPLHLNIREMSDRGKPVVVSSPDSPEVFLLFPSLLLLCSIFILVVHPFVFGFLKENTSISSSRRSEVYFYDVVPSSVCVCVVSLPGGGLQEGGISCGPEATGSE